MKIRKKGSVILFVIILSLTVSLVFVAMTYVNSRYDNILDTEKNSTRFDMDARIQNDIIMKYEKQNNIDWLWFDEKSCSWWLLQVHEWVSPICQWEWTWTWDLVDDFGDNDDYKPEYYSWNILDKITPDSKKNDNDINARINWIWIINPGETKTVFAMNKNLKNYILSNINNRIYKTINDVNAWILNITTTSNSWTWLDISFYKIDRQQFIGNKQINVLEQKKQTWLNLNLAWLLDENWNITNSWVPYFINLQDDLFDYVVNIKNNSQNIVSYTTNMTFNWERVYFVPIDDSGEYIRFLYSKYFLDDSGKLVYFEKEFVNKKPKK